MKKKLLIPIFFLVMFSAGYSQDKIITVNNDTIDCRINKISRSTIFFDIITNGIKTTGQLPLSSVLNYSVSAKAAKEATPGATPVKIKSANSYSFDRLRFGIGGGPGYLLAGSEDAEKAMVIMGLESGKAKSYYKGLKLGLQANADLTYLITPIFGAGIKYKFFNTSNSVEGFFDLQDGVHLIYTTYEEQIYTNFAGAMFFSQQFIGRNEQFKLSSSLSAGLATYRNEAGYLNGYYLLKGKNLGTDFSVGLEYFITDQISVGADLSAFYSSIRKIKITDGSTTNTMDLEKENYENLSRIDFSIGIRLYLWNR